LRENLLASGCRYGYYAVTPMALLIRTLFSHEYR
jgi:hypothetical protein